MASSYRMKKWNDKIQASVSLGGVATGITVLTMVLVTSIGTLPTIRTSTMAVAWLIPLRKYASWIKDVRSYQSQCRNA